MVDTEHDERRAVRAALAVLARPPADGVLVGANRMLGAAVAGAEAVDSADQLRHLGGRDLGARVDTLQSLVARPPVATPDRRAARHRLAGTPADDDAPLPP